MQRRTASQWPAWRVKGKAPWPCTAWTAMCMVIAGFLGCIFLYSYGTEIPRVVPGISKLFGSHLRTAQDSKTQLVLRCEDTCSEARNGVCEDGTAAKPGASAPVLCDLGTDCSDCGPFLGPRGSSWEVDAHGGPVAFIRSQNATIFAKVTLTRPTFVQPITLHSDDPDVSAMLEHYGAMEGGVTRATHEVLAGKCTAGGTPPLVLDVGAQFGYYALMAAMYGCRVIAWEPVQLFRAYLAYGAVLNNVSHLISIRPAAVGPHHGASLNISIPKRGSYWGLSSVNSMNVLPHEVARVIQVPSERIDVVVQEPVLLLKADVEGWEPQVVQSAAGLVKSGRIENMLLEYSPGIQERLRDYNALEQLPLMLASLQTAGYRIGHMPQKISTPWPPTDIGYDEAMKVLTLVTPEAVQYDLAAAQLKQAEAAGGCAVHPSMKRFGVWAKCTEWAYSAHPKGLRSAFGFNTNLWVTRNDSVMKTEGVAALFTADQDMKVWTSLQHPGLGVGLLDCKSLGVGHQVIFHCRCTNSEVCGEEQKVLLELLAKGDYPAAFAGLNTTVSGR